MATIALTRLSDELEARIMRRMRKFAPDSQELREALIRIGFLIEAQAKLNVRRQGIIDTGRLLNSIRSEFYRSGSRMGVRVGSFGVPYAALHEFGGPFTRTQRRAMFSALRDRGKLVPGSKVDKNIVQGGRFLGRPYMRPAVLLHRGRIIDIIRNLFR